MHQNYIFVLAINNFTPQFTYFSKEREGRIIKISAEEKIPLDTTTVIIAIACRLDRDRRDDITIIIIADVRWPKTSCQPVLCAKCQRQFK